MPATERLLFSTFPDAVLTPPDGPADAISIHRDLLREGRCLVSIWRWDPTTDEYRQSSLISTGDLETARAYVPKGFERIIVPADFGIEGWKAVG